mmetsp:Transcript_32279/g.43035  ORF Transcript_32279/g.43035 Transcript_32279/m.43035 type:complete len:115 (-) Transcript_32279:1392-1736(-)
MILANNMYNILTFSTPIFIISNQRSQSNKGAYLYILSSFYKKYRTRTSSINLVTSHTSQITSHILMMTFIRSTSNFKQFSISPQSFYNILSHITIPTHDLNSTIRYMFRHLRTV